MGGNRYIAEPNLSPIPDLAIVGWHNWNIDGLLIAEQVIAKLRAKNIPVILHNTHPTVGAAGTNWFDVYTWPYLPMVNELAKHYGCTMLDTYSRTVWALNQGGYTTGQFFVDSQNLHQANIGHILYSQWMRAALNTNAQVRADLKPSQNKRIFSKYSNGGFVGWPNFHAEYVGPYQVGGSVSNNVGSGNGLNSQGFGTASPINYLVGSASISVITNGTGALWLQHPFCFGVYPVIDHSTNSIGTFVVTQNSVAVGTNQLTNPGWAAYNAYPGTYVGCVEVGTDTQESTPSNWGVIGRMSSVFTSSTYAHHKNTPFFPVCCAITCTSGQLAMGGAIFLVPDYVEVPLFANSSGGGFEFGNTNGTGVTGWDTALTASSTAPNSKHWRRGTDTAGDFVRLCFTGVGASIILEGGLNGGYYSVQFDNQQQQYLNGLTAAGSGTTAAPWYFDGYVANGINNTITYMPFGSGYPASDYAGNRDTLHTITVYYTGAQNGSAGTPSTTAGSRRLAVQRAVVYKTTL